MPHSPVRATQYREGRWYALTGLGFIVCFDSQGVALGYHSTPFQG